jgi:hypothetical protein
MQKDMYFHDNDFEIAGSSESCKGTWSAAHPDCLRLDPANARCDRADYRRHKTHHVKQIFEAVHIKLSAGEGKATRKALIGHIRSLVTSRPEHQKYSIRIGITESWSGFSGGSTRKLAR